ncbi:protein of unknown function [Acidithiobacillus ferrivorans]|uniref:Uncharacterized protein n=1 Tax=Acidithiobacillus ferrivorans TaxID=160808 RepID=A0A060UNK5_9PROT|nr:hypothetical protein AFERRI_340019 [Acidithiobacillus ferrivorans]SMH65307.1 protein of unknown function [Acidithiobacillus ferrivorans]
MSGYVLVGAVGLEGQHHAPPKDPADYPFSPDNLRQRPALAPY